MKVIILSMLVILASCSKPGGDSGDSASPDFFYSLTPINLGINPAAQLTGGNTAIDFGTVVAGASASQNLIFVGTTTGGTIGLNLSTLTGSSVTQVSSTCTGTLPTARNTCKVVMKFIAPSVAGSFSESLSFNGNTINFTANVTLPPPPALTMLPNPLNMGDLDIALAAKLTKTITITNSNNIDAPLSIIYPTTDPRFTFATACQAVIPRKNTCNIVVTFKDTVAPEIDTPASVSIEINGNIIPINAVMVGKTRSQHPQFIAQQSSINYGIVPPTSAPVKKTLILQNNMSADLTNLEINNLPSWLTIQRNTCVPTFPRAITCAIDFYLNPAGQTGALSFDFEIGNSLYYVPVTITGEIGIGALCSLANATTGGVTLNKVTSVSGNLPNCLVASCDTGFKISPSEKSCIPNVLPSFKISNKNALGFVKDNNLMLSDIVFGSATQMKISFNNTCSGGTYEAVALTKSIAISSLNQAGLVSVMFKDGSSETCIHVPGDKSIELSHSFEHDNILPIVTIASHLEQQLITGNTLSFSGLCEGGLNSRSGLQGQILSQSMCLGAYTSLVVDTTLDGLYPLYIEQLDNAGNLGFALVTVKKITGCSETNAIAGGVRSLEGALTYSGNLTDGCSIVTCDAAYYDLASDQKECVAKDIVGGSFRVAKNSNGYINTPQISLNTISATYAKTFDIFENSSCSGSAIASNIPYSSTTSYSPLTPEQVSAQSVSLKFKNGSKTKCVHAPGIISGAEFNTYIQDLTAPIVTITSHTENQVVTLNSLNFSGACVSLSPSGLLAGLSGQTLSAISSCSGSYSSLAIDTTLDGTYALYVEQTDLAGNKGTATVNVKKGSLCTAANALTYGVTSLDGVLTYSGNTATACAVATCLSNFNVAADQKSCEPKDITTGTFLVTKNASGFIKTATISLNSISALNATKMDIFENATCNGSPISGNLDIAATATYSPSPSVLNNPTAQLVSLKFKNGTKTLCVSVAGAYTLAAASSFIHDSVAPIVSITSHTNNQAITVTSINFSGACQSGLGYSIGLQGQTLTNVGSCSGTYTSPAISTVSDGTYPLYIQQTDLAGNIGSALINVLKSSPCTAANALIGGVTSTDGALTYSGNTATGCSIVTCGTTYDKATDSKSCIPKDISGGSFLLTKNVNGFINSANLSINSISATNASKLSVFEADNCTGTPKVADLNYTTFYSLAFTTTIRNSGVDQPIAILFKNGSKSVCVHTTGNKTVSSSHVFRHDSLAPTVSISNFTNNQVVISPATFTMTGSCDATLGTIAAGINGSQGAVNCVSNSYTTGTLTFNEGTNTLIATQTDLAGNIGQVSVNVKKGVACGATDVANNSWNTTGAATYGGNKFGSDVTACVVSSCSGAYVLSTTAKACVLPVYASSLSTGGGSSNGFNCFIDTASKLNCWGRTVPLAVGSQAVMYPALVDSGTTYSKVSVSNVFACAITTASKLKCWGNGLIQLPGNNSPVAVDAATNYIDIAAGTNHVCGVTSASKIKCWGSNTYGQLGIPLSTTNTYTPTQITGTDNYKRVAVSEYYSCAITSLDKVKCWGFNYWNSLGYSTGVNSSSYYPTPTAIVDTDSFKDIAVSLRASCGLTTSNQIKCWGGDSSNGLGNTDATNNYNTMIKGTGGYKKVVMGKSFACAINASNRAECWGYYPGAYTSYNATPTVMDYAGGITPIWEDTFSDISSLTWSVCLKSSVDSRVICWTESGNGTGQPMDGNYIGP